MNKEIEHWQTDSDPYMNLYLNACFNFYFYFTHSALIFITLPFPEGKVIVSSTDK